MSTQYGDDILTSPVAGPTAWTASEFTRPEQWTETLTAREVAELDTALETALERDAPFAELTVDDFPLPTLSQRLKSVVRELEFGRGFSVLRGFPVANWSLEEAHTLYWGIGLHLGTPVAQNAAGELIAHVRDYSEGDLDDSSVQTRAYRTRSALPFHTDSADIVGLLCLENAGQGGASTLTSSMTIYNHLLEHHRELIGLFYRGFVYDRRSEEASGEIPYYRNAIYGYFHGQLSCRFYMRHYIESAAEKSGVPLSPIEEYALRLFQEIASREEYGIQMMLQPGDLQLLNNNVLVHGRSSFQDAPGRRRDLLRLWLNTREARNLPDDFAAFRFGMPKTT